MFASRCLPLDRPGSLPRFWRLVLVGALAAFVAAFAGPAQALLPTLRTIHVDGDVSDWTAVLVNPVQVTRDGDGSRVDCAASTDLDCPISSSGRDLRLFAWTYDTLHLYFYVERQGNTSNTETFWFFMDLDRDGLMETGEKGLRVVFSGSNSSTTTDVYLYTAANPGGDPMTDPSGNADGYTLPGFLGPASIYTEEGPDGGTPGGIIFEERIPWSVIGVSPGTPIGFHVASSNSRNPQGVATQVDDNLGALGGGGGSLDYDDVSFSPDRNGFVAPGGTISYSHEITSNGTRDAAFSLRAVSSIGTSVSLYADDDGDGTPDRLIARDADGDGDFTDAGDVIGPGWDTDGDGVPETPVLSPGETFHLIVEVTADAGMDGLFDQVVIEAFVPSDPALVSATVTDTTHVGLVVVRFDQDRTSQAGESLRYAVQACNVTTEQVLDLVATTSTPAAVRLFSDAGCDGTADAELARDAEGDGTWDSVSGGDTDGDGIPDTGLLAQGACACFVVEVAIDPATPLGTMVETTLTAQGLPAGTTSGSVVLSTRVAGRIELEPDYLFAEGTGKFSGAGRPAFFPHVARNNGTTADVIDFAVVPPVNDAGWTVTLWSDPDGDGSIADGQIITRTGLIAPNGGTYSFVVQVTVPEDVARGVMSRTVVTGVSVNDPSSRDTVTDEVVVSVLSTYSDPLYAFAATAFVPCDTVYVLATGLKARGTHQLSWSDGLENLVRFVDPWNADDAGVAEDEYTLQPGDVAGTWVIEVREDGATLDRLEITVETNARISDLTTDRTLYPQVGADLGISTTVVNDNALAPFLNTTLEHVVLNAAGDRYYDMTTGTFRPYGPGDFTRSVAVPRLDPGASWSDAFTAPAVTYPGEGVYCVVARLVASCGTVLTSRVQCFTVGAGVEQCTNGLDDDGDGLTDCEDPECGLDPNCREIPCHNGLDDDGDGLKDCADPDCALDPGCQEDCLNGLDDDGDGRIDCLDPDCDLEPSCTETACNDLIDNDRDGLVDCGDPDCEADPVCLPETQCSDGIDNDQDTAIDCLDADCRLDPACANADIDGDTVPNVSDCAPLDPGAWAVPAEVALLMVTQSPYGTARLAWTDLSAQSGPAVVYDVATGLVSDIWADRGIARAVCLSLGSTDTLSFDSRRVPVEPDAHWYLVRGVNVCGEGTWGYDSFGVERVVPACVR